MTRAQIEKRIRQIVSHAMGVPEAEIAPDSDLLHDFAAKDLDRLQIVMDVEDRFDIEVSDEDAEQFKTVGDLIEYVTRLGVAEVAA